MEGLNEGLNRFDIAMHRDVAMVIVESDLLPPDPVVVVIPLLPAYPAVRHLNPTIHHDGRPLIFATRLIAAVRRSTLRRVGSAAAQGNEITRAVDVLMAGV
jgi:toxin CcdB